MRDPQVQNVYSAERDAFDGEGFLNSLSKEQAKNKAIEVLNSDFVSNLIEKFSFVNEVSENFVIITDDKRHKYSKANHLGLVFAEGARSMIILLHEIAHSLTMECSEKGKTPFGEVFTNHGPHFAFVYLKLVEEFLGIDYYCDLAAGFIANNVNFSPIETKKKPVVDEIEKFWEEIEECDLCDMVFA